MNKLKEIDTSKSIPVATIPGKILKDHKDIICDKVTELLDLHVNKTKYPCCMKLADVHPAFKKGVRSSIDNYRPVSILTYSSQIFERLLHDQI